MRILSILFFSGAPLNHRKLIFEKKEEEKKSLILRHFEIDRLWY